MACLNGGVEIYQSINHDSDEVYELGGIVGGRMLLSQCS